MVRKLEDMENICAIEISFEPHMDEENILRSVSHCLGEIPVIVQIELGRVTSLGSRVIREGASAVSFAPPRGIILLEIESKGSETKSLVSGRLYGPCLFPQSLLVLQEAVWQDLPIIAGVGVNSAEQAELMLSIGALAVQFDTFLWK